MNNYKIKVNNESESREAQELFFELGYEWNGSGKEVVSWRLGLLFTKDFQGKNCLCYFDKDEDVMLDGWVGKELTLPELRDLVAKSKPTEQGLISGADALRALADGETVEVKRIHDNEWQPAQIFGVSVFTDSETTSFRIKPRTITLNIEIPAPFEPKEGEEFFILAPLSVTGYTKVQGITTQALLDEYVKLGAWRTEEQVKQVVAALRGGIKA